METLDENTLHQYKKRNRKLIILYKMLAYDLLFYYTISYLFLTNVKGLTTAQIVFADSFYPLFKLLFQVPCTVLIQKTGKRNSLIIANISLAIYLILVICLFNTFTLIIANIFCAFGYVIKGMAESNILYDSLDNTDNKRELFSKYEGKSYAGYYFFDAITAVLTGFLYAFNPFLPMIISLIITIITIFLISCVYDIHHEKSEIEINDSSDKSIVAQIKLYFNDIIGGFKFIFKSPRLKSLILFSGFFSSILSLMVTLRRSILKDVNVSSENFGIIFAVMGILASITSSRSLAIHKKYHNKTLSFLGITFSISIIICGAVVLVDFPLFLMYYLLLIMIAIQYAIKGPYTTLIRQYLNSFSNSDMRLKIYSANALVEYTFNTIISILCSFALTYLSNASTTLILGILSLILILLLLNYMSTRVGLKPEEYSEKDIAYDDNKMRQ